MAGRRPTFARKSPGSRPGSDATLERERARSHASSSTTASPSLSSNGTTVSIEEQLRTAVSERLGTARFDLWFGEGVKLGLATMSEGGESIEIGVPNLFFREWIEGHFASNLIDAAEAVTGRALPITFRIDGEAEPKIGQTEDDSEPSEFRESRTVKLPIGPNPGPLTPVAPYPSAPADRPRPAPRRQDASSATSNTAPRIVRRLEDFVTGSCNRLAHAACLEMATTLGGSFNPLVVHGGVGLGKTHLLEGVGHAIRATRPGLRLIHVTAEAFTNGFLDAMRSASLGSFRSRFRGAEALIIDDIHFLAAKRATQDEFLHTFNALLADSVPIILACDQHPRMVVKLTEELSTRFLGGMVGKVESPDPTTRRAILKSKALARGIDVPDAVIAYIADHLRASVRELEGALHSLIAHAVLTGKKLDLNLAKSALRDTIRHTAQAVALKDVERAICGLFQIEPEALKSESRVRALTFPRMIGMYLSRKHTGAAYTEIGRFFGGRNHSTVISAEKKVVGWLTLEKERPPLAGFETVAEVLAALERTLGT